MDMNPGEQEASMVEPIMVEAIPLLSTAAASKIAGVSRRLWPAMAEANGLQPIPAGGSGRVRWRATEVVQLVTGRDTT
jgi:hypothetical protein